MSPGDKNRGHTHQRKRSAAAAEVYFLKSLAPFGEDVLGLAGKTAGRRDADCDLACGAHLCHHTGQRAAVSQRVPLHRRRPGTRSRPPHDYCAERTAMMPKRRRTRAHHIATERRHNRDARLVQRAECSTYVGPAPPQADDDPPPF